MCAQAPPSSRHTTVCLCLSSRTHTFSFVACLGAVVLPMQKGGVGGSPPSHSSPCSLVGPTPLLVSVVGTGRASVVCNILAPAPRPGMCPHLFLLFFLFVAPLVCTAWHNMVTYLRDSLLSLLIFSCDVCLGAVVLPIQVSVWGRGLFLLLFSLGRSLLARALATLPCPCAHVWRGLLHVCVRHGSTHLFGYLCSLSFSRAQRGKQHTCATPSLSVSCRLLRVLAPLYSPFMRACGGGGFSSYTPRWAGLGSHLCCRALAFTHLFGVLYSLPFPCARPGM